MAVLATVMAWERLPHNHAFVPLCLPPRRMLQGWCRERTRVADEAMPS